MIRTELTLRLPNSPGALAAVCRALADERVTVLALMLDAGGRLRFVPDNPVRAAGVLRGLHHAVDDREVIVSSAAPGPEAFASVLKMVSDAGVNIDYAYTGTGGPVAIVVIGVEDAQRAAARAGI